MMASLCVWLPATACCPCCFSFNILKNDVWVVIVYDHQTLLNLWVSLMYSYTFEFGQKWPFPFPTPQYTKGPWVNTSACHQREGSRKFGKDLILRKRVLSQHNPTGFILRKMDLTCQLIHCHSLYRDQDLTQQQPTYPILPKVFTRLSKSLNSGISITSVATGS